MHILGLNLLLELLLVLDLLLKVSLWLLLHHDLDLLANELLLLSLFLLFIVQIVAFLNVVEELLKLFVRKLVKVKFQLLLVPLVVLGLVVLYNGKNSSELLVVKCADLGDELMPIVIKWGQ